jgi:transcriptional regulator with XRE-family HTH domain
MASRGERLQQALEARGIRKQMALAAELGVDESAISRWQRNAGLSLMHAARLCEVLDISMDWLVLGRGDMDLHHRPEAASAERGSAGQLVPLPAAIAEAIIKLADVISAALS